MAEMTKEQFEGLPGRGGNYRMLAASVLVLGKTVEQVVEEHHFMGVNVLALKDKIRRLRKQFAKQQALYGGVQWTKVEDGLPLLPGSYLVALNLPSGRDYGVVKVARAPEWFSKSVIAWAPLPEYRV